MTEATWRVAVVAPPFYELPPRGYGGTELVCHVLAEGLVARGHDVTLVGAGPHRTSARFVATFAEAQTEAAAGARRVEEAHFARARAAVADLDPDVVHDHTALGLRHGSGPGRPVVATVHHALAGPDAPADPAAVAPGVRPVALSDAQRRDAPDLPWAATVPNGIELDRYPVRRDKGDFALYLGRLSPHKGVHLAVDAARAAGVPLVVAGSWTVPAERDYVDAVLRPRLGPDVEWVGPVGFEEKVELLGRAGCLLFPVRWHEPFGLVLVEAQACGTPVVALDAGAVRELVDDGVTGVVCRTPASLPAAIGRARRLDPDRCRAHVAARFSVEQMVARYEAVYRQALDDHVRASRSRAEHGGAGSTSPGRA